MRSSLQKCRVPAAIGQARTAATAAAAREPAERGARRMQAWRVHAYGGLAELRLEEARVPPLRAPDELLVRVRAASLNPLDVAMIGGYGQRALNGLRALERLRGAGGGAGGVEFPLVAGRDFVGDVVAAGAVARAPLGQRVWGVVPPHWPGAHAQYVVIKDRWAGAAPGALDDLQAGGALYAALTACAALRVAGLPAGRRAPPNARVLLLGLGGVGQAALQLLVHAGAQVVVGCTAEMCGRAHELGASAALDRHAPEYAAQLEEGGPYTCIVDCAGLGGGEASARRWRYARYVTLTTPLLRETDAHGALGGALAAARELALQNSAAARAGGTPGACPPHVRWAFFVPRTDDIELLRRLAERGQLAVGVQRAWGWREGGEAYACAAAGHARGKLLLDFTAG